LRAATGEGSTLVGGVWWMGGPPGYEISYHDYSVCVCVLAGAAAAGSGDHDNNTTQPPIRQPTTTNRRAPRRHAKKKEKKNRQVGFPPPTTMPSWRRRSVLLLLLHASSCAATGQRACVSRRVWMGGGSLRMPGRVTRETSQSETGPWTDASIRHGGGEHDAGAGAWSLLLLLLLLKGMLPLLQVLRTELAQQSPSC
jgi:hypothetical protein